MESNPREVDPMKESGSDRTARPPDAKRVPVVKRVRTRFARFGEFVTQYSTNMSMTGMFLRTDEPQAPGSRFEFEFVISDEAPMIHCTGEVVWVREKSESEERPAGMGVRFVELDPKSRRVIRWLMEKAVIDGHEPFELGEEHEAGWFGSVFGDSTEEGGGRKLGKTAAPADAEHVQSASSMRNQKVRESRRFRGDLVALAVVAVAVLAWWLMVRAESPVPGDPVEPSVGATESVPATASPASPGPAEEIGAAARTSEVESEEILSEVRAWARDWTERDAERYLSHYSVDFETPANMTRGQWEAGRRERLAAPEYIRVALSGLEVENLEPERATVSFFQSYRSNLLDETVRKRLTLIRQNGAWKIVEESRQERVPG